MAINAVDFLAALEEIEASKGISKEAILQMYLQSGQYMKEHRRQNWEGSHHC